MPDSLSSSVPTGIPNLDHVLAGGYERNRLHLVEGLPGTGKTTLALQFLLAGQARGEKCLYVTISESEHELRHMSATHGLSLEGIEILELVPVSLSLDPERQQSIVHSSDLELGETIQVLMQQISIKKPTLVVLDSLSEIRLMAQSALVYRHHILILKQFFYVEGCTALLLDDMTNDSENFNLHSIAHLVMLLEQQAQTYGPERRRLRIFKMRGRAFRGGYHDCAIRKGGIALFPRLAEADMAEQSSYGHPVSSGIRELDEMVGGGLESGTTTLIEGPSGTGKSTVALQFLKHLLTEGKKALFISFDETSSNFERRISGMNMGLRPYLDGGELTYLTIDLAEVSPGELSDIVRTHVTEGTCAVVIDSLSGFQHALRDDITLLSLQLHELTTWLNGRYVLTLLVHTTSGPIGTPLTSFDIAYLADAVLLLRFFEADGEVRRCISVLKKRSGPQERKVREVFFGAQGMRVGPQLAGLEHILTATPLYVGKEPLFSELDSAAAL